MIFISYSRFDKALLPEFVDLLKDLGYEDIWYDKDVETGKEWWDSILNNIFESDLIITLVSENYLKSNACRSEYEYSIETNCKILPIILFNKEITLPSKLFQIQHIFYNKEDISSIKSISKALKQQLFDKQKKSKQNIDKPKTPNLEFHMIHEDLDKHENFSYDEEEQVLKRIKELNIAGDLRQKLYKKFKNRKKIGADIKDELEDMIAKYEVQIDLFIKNKKVFNLPSNVSKKDLQENKELYNQYFVIFESINNANIEQYIKVYKLINKIEDCKKSHDIIHKFKYIPKIYNNEELKDLYDEVSQNELEVKGIKKFIPKIIRDVF